MADPLSIGMRVLTAWRGTSAQFATARSHGEVELALVESGELTYQMGANRFAFPAGQLAVFWAAKPHKVIHAEKGTILNRLTLPLAWFLRFQLPEPLTNGVLHGKFVVEADKTLATSDGLLFARWVSDLRDSSKDRQKIVMLEVEARLRRLGLSVRAGRKLPTPDESGLDKVEQMARFIAEHSTEELQVSDIAEAVRLHPNYAMSLFRRDTGVSLLRYLTRHRVLHAQRLLATTNLKTIEVAFNCGFGSVSQFYTIFKKACGYTPRAYRISIENITNPR